MTVPALAKPLTEIEKAELLQACTGVLKPDGLMLLRRALFELDLLKTRDRNHTPPRPDPYGPFGSH